MKNIFKALLLIFALTLILTSLTVPAFATEQVESDGGTTDKIEEIKSNTVKNTYTDEDDNLIIVLENGKKYNVTKQEWVTENAGQSKGISLDFNVERMLSSLQYMWQGMLCIFVVIGVIFLSVYLIGFLSAKAEERKSLKEENE